MSVVPAEVVAQLELLAVPPVKVFQLASMPPLKYAAVGVALTAVTFKINAVVVVEVRFSCAPPQLPPRVNWPPPAVSPPPGVVRSVRAPVLNVPSAVMLRLMPPAPMDVTKPAPRVMVSAVAPLISMFRLLGLLAAPPMVKTVAPPVALLIVRVLIPPERSDSVPPVAPLPPAMVTLGLPLVPMVELPLTCRAAPAETLTAVPASELVELSARVPPLIVVAPV